ncbi:MAG: PQQ-binding-like beta-propeller repeat protein [Planctomycetaceae bacterium]
MTRKPRALGWSLRARRMVAGVADCWNNQTGEVMCRARLGGRCSASPVVAGGNLYVSSERGITYVFKSQSDAYHPVCRNQLGDGAFASPAVCGGQIFVRAVSLRPGRQQFRYCVAVPETVTLEESR